MTLDVGAASIEGINLEVTPPVALKLRFRDADWQEYKTKMKEVSFELRGEDLKESKPPSDNGEFTMDKLAPGSYHVAVDGLPENLYVKAMRSWQGETTSNAIGVGYTLEEQVDI